MLRFSRSLLQSKTALSQLVNSTFNCKSRVNVTASSKILKNHQKYLRNNTYKYLQVLAYNRFENDQIQRIVEFKDDDKVASSSANSNLAEKIRLQELETFLKRRIHSGGESIPETWKSENFVNFSSPDNKNFTKIYGNSPDLFHEHLEYLSGIFLEYNIEVDEINEILTKCPEMIYDLATWADPAWGLPSTGDNNGQSSGCMLDFRISGMQDKDIFPFFKSDLRLNLITAPRAWLISPIAHQLSKLMYLTRDMNMSPAHSLRGGMTKKKKTFLIEPNLTNKISVGGLMNYPLMHIQARHLFLMRRGDWNEPNTKGVIEGNHNRNPNPLHVIRNSDEDFILKVCKYPKELLESGLSEYDTFKTVFYQECIEALDEGTIFDDNIDYEEALHRKFSYDQKFTSESRSLGRNDYDRKKSEQVFREKYEQEAMSENPIENSVVNMIRNEL